MTVDEDTATPWRSRCQEGFRGHEPGASTDRVFRILAMDVSGMVKVLHTPRGVGSDDRYPDRGVGSSGVHDRIEQPGRLRSAVPLVTDADDLLPFDAQFRRHWGTVFAILYRLTGTREEAEDLAQEVFIRLHQRGPRVAHESNLGGWLYRVATNLGYNALRGRRRRIIRENRVAADEPTTAEPPLLSIIADEERADVRAVLATLTERHQACLVLRYQGLSYAETAAALGVAPGSVGSILARAEREFRERYEAQRGGL